MRHISQIFTRPFLTTMRPAVAYIRVSKPEQGRSGLGLEAQQAAIKAFCAQHGYKIEAEYRPGKALPHWCDGLSSRRP